MAATPIFPLRIALLSLHTSPLAPLGGEKTGGMNVYVREIGRELAKRGLWVDTFTRTADPAEVGQILGLEERHRLIYLPCGAPQSLPTDALIPHLHEFREGLEAFRQREKKTYHILFSHYWLSGWVALGLRGRWGAPIVQMFHTLGRMKNRIAFTEQFAPESDPRVLGETEILHRADRIIAATPAERAQMLLLYRADPRKLEIIPPGVDVERFFPASRRQAQAEVGFDPQAEHLLFVGRIEPLKGLDSVIEALVYLRQNAPSQFERLHLHIVGGDPRKPNAELGRLIDEVRGQDLGAQVHFVGAKGQDELPAYYRAATALVMPSDYESFGMVALEAMACGTPVIASQVGGLAFLVQDGVTGYHVPVREPHALADNILRLMADPHERERLGANAALSAQNYRWGHIADRLLELFTQLRTRPAILHLP
jgi:D-inositol-3-phosphate glycosyltransferase